MWSDQDKEGFTLLTNSIQLRQVKRLTLAHPWIAVFTQTPYMKCGSFVEVRMLMH